MVVSRAARLACAAGMVAVLAGARCGTDTEDAGTGVAPRDAGNLGATGGQCAQACNTAADCCSGTLCGQGVFHYACDQGRCQQIGCVSDSDCSVLTGGKCGVLGDFGLCGVGCATPADCCPPLPPGVTIPDGQDRVTVTFDGGQATFYRCGIYPQKFACTGLDVAPDDAGSVGICLRVCSQDDDCPGIPLPVLADGGFAPVRVDAGFVGVPLGDGGTLTRFQQKCSLLFGAIGQCVPQCQVDADCCADPTGATCAGLGARQVCVAGACVQDGCRSDTECTSGQLCLPRN